MKTSVTATLWVIGLSIFPGNSASAQSTFPRPAQLIEKSLEYALFGSAKSSTVWLDEGEGVDSLIGTMPGPHITPTEAIDLGRLRTQLGREVHVHRYAEAVRCVNAFECTVEDGGLIVTLSSISPVLEVRGSSEVTLWVRVRWTERNSPSDLIGFSVKYLARFEAGDWVIVEELQRLMI